jgi:hypothetical protein
VTVDGSGARLSRADAAAICDSHPAFVDGNPPEEKVNMWHYAHLK